VDRNTNLHLDRHTHLHVDRQVNRHIDSYIGSTFLGCMLSALSKMTSPDGIHSDRAVCYFFSVYNHRRQDDLDVFCTIMLGHCSLSCCLQPTFSFCIQSQIGRTTLLHSIQSCLGDCTSSYCIQSYLGRMTSTLWPSSWTARPSAVTTSPMPPTWKGKPCLPFNNNSWKGNTSCACLSTTEGRQTSAERWHDTACACHTCQQLTHQTSVCLHMESTCDCF